VTLIVSFSDSKSTTAVLVKAGSKTNIRRLLKTTSRTATACYSRGLALSLSFKQGSQVATQDHNREQQRRAVPAGLLFRFLIFFSPLLKTTIVNNNGVLFTRACSFADQRPVLTSPSETSQGPPITHVARRQHEVLGSAQRQ
jgi:hypothetical protein